MTTFREAEAAIVAAYLADFPAVRVHRWRDQGLGASVRAGKGQARILTGAAGATWGEVAARIIGDRERVLKVRAEHEAANVERRARYAREAASGDLLEALRETVRALVCLNAGRVCGRCVPCRAGERARIAILKAEGRASIGDALRGYDTQGGA